MTQKELIAVAKPLGIKTKGLTNAQLEAAIAEAQANAGASGNNGSNESEGSGDAENQDRQFESEGSEAFGEEAPHQLHVKLVDDETAPRKEVVPFTPIAYKSESGDFEVTVPKFRYRGNEYDTATAIEQNSDLIEELIRLKSFIVKRK